MDLQTYIDERNLTRYRLSQISGVPKTTITDICSGKSDIGRCSAHTVQQLAKALGCTMEELMEFAPCRKDGRPKDRTYLEHGLPGFLQESLDAMKSAWEKLDRGENYLRWDCDYCSLQRDLNVDEVEQMISSEQAWYLREKYLRIERV